MTWRLLVQEIFEDQNREMWSFYNNLIIFENKSFSWSFRQNILSGNKPKFFSNFSSIHFFINSSRNFFPSFHQFTFSSIQAEIFFQFFINSLFHQFTFDFVENIINNIWQFYIILTNSKLKTITVIFSEQ